MSYDNNPKRFWYSARQVDSAMPVARYDSGWCFGDDLEKAKAAAVQAVKKTRELCPGSFTPDFTLTGTSIEFSLVQNVPDNPLYEIFTVKV